MSEKKQEGILMNQASQASVDENVKIPDVVSILPVRNTILFPFSVFPLTVGRESSVKLVEELSRDDHKVLGIVGQREPSEDDPQQVDLFEVGTIGLALKQVKVQDRSVVLFVRGLKRFRIKEVVQTKPYLKAIVEVLEDVVGQKDESEAEALRRSLRALFQQIVNSSPELSGELITVASNLENLSELGDFIASTVPSFSHRKKQEYLETLDVWKRLEKLHLDLARESEILDLRSKLHSQVQDEVGKTQREYYLRQQLKAIQDELGEGDDAGHDIEELKKSIEDANLPEEARVEADRELKRLARMQPASPEYTVAKTYLDWLVVLPWNKLSEAPFDLHQAHSILERDHYGLEKIKERILEHLAVLKLRPEGKAPILCFVGPPGVGKTSLGKSIAEALGRKFVRLSLGGIRDEAEIRGHRRTYIGSLPGQIIQGIRRAGERNPVFMLDEIDKIGTDFRGDPASALLEVLDPEQNHSFRDHYLDVPFDLSRVLFVTTANILDTVPPALRDRMEVIELHGYTEEEKVKIAQQYLMPRQAQANGIELGEHLQLSEESLRFLIRYYTREAGLRNLEREIGRICRKRARQLVDEKNELVTIDVADLPDLLGAPRFAPEEEIEARASVPGVVVGLAWTPTGGDILFVEATKMKGHEKLTLTGQLGEVMRESAKAALSWVRAHAQELGIPEDFYETSDIHIHIPAGAIPKDGPSAGIALVAALVSVLTGRPLTSKVAMTGEITLAGAVLPVGGIKEKVLAAHRVGIGEVVLPKENEKNIKEDLSAEVARKMRFRFVSSITEVMEAVLGLGNRTESPRRERWVGRTDQLNRN